MECGGRKIPNGSDKASSQKGKGVWFSILRELKPHKFGLTIALVLGIVVSGLSLLQPLLIGSIVNSVSSGLDFRLVVLSACCLLFAALLSAFEQYLLERIGEMMVFRIRNDVAARVVGARLATIKSVQTGDLASALGADTAQLRGILSQGVIEVVVQSLTLLGALFMMFSVDWILSAVVVVAVLLLLFSGILLGSRTRPAAEAVQESVGQMSASFSRVLGGIRTVKAFVGEQSFLVSIQKAAELARVNGLRVARLKAVVSGFMQSAIQIILFVVVGLGAIRVASGSLTIGDLTSFIMYVMLVFTPAAMLGGVVTSISEGVGAYSRVARFRAWPQELSCVFGKHESSPPDNNLEVSLNNIHLSYPIDAKESSRSEEHALIDVSISVESGSFVALVGRSGAGKSSIFNVLEGFYLPQEGSVFVDRISLGSVPMHQWRKNFALIDQDAPVFAGSVKDNLKFVNPGASDEELNIALGQARVYIGGRMASLSMTLGEGGTGLSGGERQRLALARAFLSDAPIILLDEATSSLDSITEQEVHEALFKLRRDKTVIVIAHRLATISSADNIYVIDEGRIVAEGNHFELLRDCNLYRELVKSQAIAK